MFIKRKFNWGILFGALIAIILAVAALYASQIEKRSFERFKLTAKETDAVITDIHKERVRRRSGGKTRTRVQHTVTVKYNVDDKDYTTTLNYYTSNMHEGGTVKIYYDPENPEYSMTDPKISNIVLTVLGCIFLLVGLVMLLMELKSYAQINGVIRQGQYIICDMWQEKDAPLTVNGVRYHWIECHYIDDRGGEHKFFSGTFHPNRAPFIEGLPVKVYVDLYKPKIYFVSDDGHR